MENLAQAKLSTESGWIFIFNNPLDSERKISINKICALSVERTWEGIAKNMEFIFNLCLSGTRCDISFNQVYDSFANRTRRSSFQSVFNFGTAKPDLGAESGRGLSFEDPLNELRDIKSDKLIALLFQRSQKRANLIKLLNDFFLRGVGSNETLDILDNKLTKSASGLFNSSLLDVDFTMFVNNSR